MHLPPQTTMGEMAIDALNSGNWYPDNDPEHEEGRAAPDNRGGPILLGGLFTLFLGIAVAPVAAVAFGAGSAITALAAHFSRG